MIIDREYKNLRKMGKKILNKETFRKINHLTGDERSETLTNTIKSNLSLRYHDLITKIKHEEDVFLTYLMASLDSKIKIFNATLAKEDFDKVFLLFHKIYSELKEKNSQSIIT